MDKDKLDKFGNRIEPRIKRLQIVDTPLWANLAGDSQMSKDPKGWSARTFVASIKREKALCQQFFGGPSSPFWQFVFPIQISKGMVEGWGTVESVPPEDRATVLTQLRCARHRAMFKKIDLREKEIGTFLDPNDDYIIDFINCLKEDLRDDEEKGRAKEFSEQWTSIAEAFRQGRYYFTKEDEDDCADLYMDDDELQEAIRRRKDGAERVEGQPAQSSRSLVAPEKAEGQIVHTALLNTTKIMEMIPTPEVADKDYWTKVQNSLEHARTRNYIIPHHTEIIPVQVSYTVNQLLRIEGVIAEEQEWHHKFTLKALVDHMLQRCGKGKTITARTKAEEIKALPFKLDRRDINNAHGPMALSQACAKLCKTDAKVVDYNEFLSQADQEGLLKHFKELLKKEVDQPKLYTEVHEQIFGLGADRPTNLDGFLKRLLTVLVAICRHHEMYDKVKEDDYGDDSPKVGEKRKGTKPPPRPTREGKPSLCTTCGRQEKDDHAKGCPYKAHPNANKHTQAWRECQFGKKFMELPKGTEWTKLPPNQKLGTDGKLVYLTEAELKTVYKDNRTLLDKYVALSQKRQKVSSSFTHNSLNYFNNDSTFNPHVFGRLAEERTDIGQGILDSGSFGYIANYISREAYDRLAKIGLASSHRCKLAKVCSVGHCIINDTCTKLSLEVYSESVERHIVIPFEARIVEGLPYDFIIGLPSVRRHCLTKVFDHIFADEQVSQAVESKTKKKARARGDEVTSTAKETALPHKKWKRSTTDIWTEPKLVQQPLLATNATHGSGYPSVAHGIQGYGYHCEACKETSIEEEHCKLYCIQCSSKRMYPNMPTVETRSSSPLVLNTAAAKVSIQSVPLDNCHVQRSDLLKLRMRARQVLLPILHRDDLLDKEDDTDYLDEYFDESPHDRLVNNKELPIESEKDKAILEGTEEFVQKYKELLAEYETRLRTSLGTEPARIEPFVLELKEGSNWYTSPKHQLAPRPLTLAKEMAMDTFVEKALEQDIIEPSFAVSWSHPNLQPKPNGDWRFTMDFRYANDNTKSLGWPLPNIGQMFERIGRARPKYFAVLDLTQGFYQAAISIESRPITAFRTTKGLYQWKRLPMGLKGAPSYFQHAMQTKVLGDIMYKMCEVYLDDIIVYAQSETELLQHLRQVFIRLERFNITLNPAKVRVGMKSIEYLGHKIDSEGLSFSREKLDDVWQTPLPTTKKALKSFLGLCVQFHEHVLNYSTIVAPLHKLLPNYEKKHANHPIEWTEETRKTFADVQKAVNECPKIFFPDRNAPIYLHTDASAYGIGGYLFQKIEEKEVPIMFLSKALNTTERKWSVYEKEGYAIFYSFMKMEHLLRDTHFVLRTDHKNLTFINTDMRDKVKRWKLAIQCFDFDVEHIAGEKNIEADGFSRLIQTPEGEPLEVVVQNKIFALRHIRPKLDRLSQEVFQKIALFHNAKVGHLGVEKTIAKVKEAKLEWEGMRSDIQLFIKRCPCCQKMSVLKPLIQTQPFTLASYSPFDRICIDTIGPLPKDDESGSEHLLVIIDAFSRFVKLYAIKDTSARSALQGLLDWIGMFGIPSEMVSDNGTQFANELVQDLLATFDTTDAKIQAYSKEENGLVERANKEVNRHLRTLVYDKKVKRKWATYVPLVQRIMNASVHNTLGVSPAQIVFGNSVRLDRNLLPIQSNVHSSNVQEYLASLLQAQKDIIEIAARNQMESDQFHIATRGGKKGITEFPINSYVLVNYEANDHRPPSKLHTQLRGPLRVVNRNGSIYTLENLVKNKLEDFHIKLLHPFEYDSALVDPREVAQHDEDQFGIVKVHDHRFTNTKQTKQYLEFLVEFEDNTTPVWQPWSPDIRDNEQIHVYLAKNNMRKFIPVKYTYPKDHPLYEKPVIIQKVRAERKKRRKFGTYKV